MPSLTQALSEALMRPVSAADRARTSLHLLDWFACAIAALPSPVAAKLRATVVRWSGPGPCSTLGVGARDWQSALWLNAALGNVEEMDDVHRTSILHPGPVVIPAALAVAERIGATPGDLLDAIVRGYEATIRIGRALGAGHYRFYHNTASCGGFGAAAAAASLLKLSGQQLGWALGNAGSRTGGLWQLRNEAVDTKQFHTVDAALTGVLAAMMAADDVSGPAEILEGPQGMFAAMAPDANAGALLHDLTGQWLIYDCSFKPWPACRHVHPTIDALRDLLSRYPVPADEVAGVTVSTYADALTFCNRPQPETRQQAKFSLQHAVAVVLNYGTPDFDHFLPAVVARPRMNWLRKKITVQESAARTAAYPEHFGAEVMLTCTDGRQFSAAVDDAWGDPARPMSAQDIEHKATRLLANVERDAAPLIAAINQLAAAVDFETLYRCLDALTLDRLLASRGTP